MEQRDIGIQEEQTLGISVNGASYTFRFYPFRNLMYMDLTQNEIDIIRGKRVIPNKWLIPNYVAEGSGNVRFETYDADGDDYVWWEGFNTKFRLMVYTDDEIKVLEEEEK